MATSLPVSTRLTQPIMLSSSSVTRPNVVETSRQGSQHQSVVVNLPLAHIISINTPRKSIIVPEACNLSHSAITFSELSITQGHGASMAFYIITRWSKGRACRTRIRSTIKRNMGIMHHKSLPFYCHHNQALECGTHPSLYFHHTPLVFPSHYVAHLACPQLDTKRSATMVLSRTDDGS